MGSKVLDASAFYAGVPFGADDGWYTTSLVLEEIRHIKKSQDVLSTMIEAGRLRVREPREDASARAVRESKETGDFRQLSRQDISVLALAVEMGGQIVTDDFAVSNVARSLGVGVLPIMTEGIRDEGTWMHYCPGCRKNFKNQKECPLCGTALRRRLVRKG